MQDSLLEMGMQDNLLETRVCKIVYWRSRNVRICVFKA